MVVDRTRSTSEEEIERLTLSGVLRPVGYSRWVSRRFLVPKPSGSGWRLIVDLKEINKACQTRRIKIEILRSLRIIAMSGDNWVSFDLKDGIFSLAIAPLPSFPRQRGVDGQPRRQVVAILRAIDALLFF